ncbi:MAG: glutathione S-transferase [Kangiellaceae bacterium]|nr:glutathione S-transferase [Kangiellaceae bacterium]
MITLHYLENSRAQRILWLLEELGLQYEIKHYHRDSKTMLAPAELKKIHPLGKSPVITDGDLCVAESAAIVEYLINTYGEGNLVPPRNTKEYLKYRERMHYAEGSIMPFMLLSLIFNKIKEAPMFFLAKIVARKIADKTFSSFITPNVKTHLEFLEQELQESKWFAGNELTGADFMMSFSIEAAAARTNMSEKYPNLNKFLETIHAMPSYQTALKKGLPYQLGK